MERVGLIALLEAQTLTVDQVQTIQEFAAKVGETLAAIERDFDAQRAIIEALDVWVTLAEEDGQKVAYVTACLGHGSLEIASNPTRRTGHNSLLPFSLTARLRLDCSGRRRKTQGNTGRAA
jgi:hypothetical protein